MLTTAKYLYGSIDVTFKNKIYLNNDCKKVTELICNNIIDNNTIESIVYDESSKILKHHWIEYESGKYVFDKTQVIKSNRTDNYSCELLSNWSLANFFSIISLVTGLSKDIAPRDPCL